MTAGPFGDDIGDDAAVVVRAEHELGAGRSGGVDPVHPCIAEVDDVSEVAERPLLNPGASMLIFIDRIGRGVRVRPLTVFGGARTLVSRGRFTSIDPVLANL